VLSIIAWTCILLSAAVLLVSSAAFLRVWRKGRSYRVVVLESLSRDALVIALWITTLVCGVGLLRRQFWGWAGVQVAAAGMLAWMCFLAWHRLKMARELDPDIPGTWKRSLAGHLIVLLALGAVVAGLFVYLQSGGVRGQLYRGGGTGSSARPGSAARPVYQWFAEQGRLAPAGQTYVASRVTPGHREGL